MSSRPILSWILCFFSKNLKTGNIDTILPVGKTRLKFSRNFLAFSSFTENRFEAIIIHITFTADTPNKPFAYKKIVFLYYSP